MFVTLLPESKSRDDTFVKIFDMEISDSLTFVSIALTAAGLDVLSCDTVGTGDGITDGPIDGIDAVVTVAANKSNRKASEDTSDALYPFEEDRNDSVPVDSTVSFLSVLVVLKLELRISSSYNCFPSFSSTINSMRTTGTNLRIHVLLGLVRETSKPAFIFFLPLFEGVGVEHVASLVQLLVQ